MDISNDNYLKAFALFCLATEYQRKCDEFETEMNKLLADENGSHASDAIYEYGAVATIERFDEAIKKMGLTPTDT